ncbi:MAG TPA: hypothetical protein VE053_06850 [Allosphingosinicella sp.]|nr:hypothetical protein [Allosphingosinicella sp.]
MNPKVALRSYLDNHDIRPAAFARAISYDKGNFHRLLHAEDAFWPSLELALRIERETSGAVPMSLWAEAKAA